MTEVIKFPTYIFCAVSARLPFYLSPSRNGAGFQQIRQNELVRFVSELGNWLLEKAVYTSKDNRDASVAFSSSGYMQLTCSNGGNRAVTEEEQTPGEIPQNGRFMPCN